LKRREELKKWGIDRKPENKLCQKNEKRLKICSKFYGIEVGALVGERYGRLIVDLPEKYCTEVKCSVI
jgi:hypothetical protein